VLSEVDAAAGDVSPGIDVRDPVDWAGIPSHPHPQMRPASERPRQLHRATQGRHRIAEEDEGYPVAGGKTDRIVLRQRAGELRGEAHQLLQLL
jgi:hypothetical protein